MRQEIKDVVNVASAENARVLITDNEIRLQFPTKEHAVRFMETITELHPQLRLKACAFWRNIDVFYPTAKAA